MNQKPQVFPSQEERIAAAREIEKNKLEAYEREKAQVANSIYQSSEAPPDTPEGHISAVEMMRQRTEYQMKVRNQSGSYDGIVQHPELAEDASKKIAQDAFVKRSEEQMRLRDAQLAKNKEQIDNYQKQAAEAMGRNNINVPPVQNTDNRYTNTNQNNYVPPQGPPQVPPVMYGDNMGRTPSNVNSYILELSQPNYNSPFDVLPLPSEGKLYRSKRANVKTSFMTTADENILTSPNLLQSGEFLEILINRKLLEPDLRYKNLHVGDRNAIMIWLRATGYGEMYPVTLLDENNVPFETQVNLNELKTKKLGAEPDEEGLFSYTFKLCKANIRFKFLTCGDIDAIEKLVEADKANGLPVDNTSTYTMERMVVEVNGSRDRYVVKEFSNNVRIKDGQDFNAYVDSIESGIDLNIEIRTPGGESIKTFLPLNIYFFWPNIKL
jgi:hypothetical protein